VFLCPQSEVAVSICQYITFQKFSMVKEIRV
jgi:hypothetical protein